jgi:lipopolysaccharide/colanic/teichoic acid biosynthesis glycosyltransferase
MNQPEKDIKILKSWWWHPWMESILCTMALFLLSPLLLVIAACIFMDSGLPIVFSQSRVGRNGKCFRLFKFRTMRHAASGPSLTVRGDCRVTQVGYFLRKFKLDELPQLWNVVRAEMSIVGPRPEVPEFVDFGNPVWQYVLKVRPGITDPASIAFYQEEKLLAKSSDPIRYYRETLLPAKLAMNIAYLQERSLWHDLQVVLRTALCVAFPAKLKSQQKRLLAQEDSE